MNKRRSSQNRRCPKCKINLIHCFCNEIKMHETETRISIIMHHREKYLTSNTAKLAELTLNQAKIFLRGLPLSPFSIEQIDLSNSTPLYLFPDEEAITLNHDFLTKNKGKFHLIVPDGTWSQVKKVKRREKGLNEIQSVKLPDNIIGEYKLRRNIFDGGVCTFEAIIHALSILEEDKTIAVDLMRQFRIMNNRVAKSRSGLDNNI